MSAVSPPLLSLRGVGHDFGHGTLFETVDLSVRPGDRICLVGRNGCGKSTLLGILAGMIVPDEGERWCRADVRVAYIDQEPLVPPGMQVADVVARGLRAEDEGQAHLVAAALDSVGISPAARTDGMSGGEQRRVVIAAALVGRPEVLLLDEPTNHLDLPAIEWLERHLERFEGALVMVSHDRRFLTRLSRRTVWIDRGCARTREAGFAGTEEWMEQVYAEEEKSRAQLDKLIASETRWSREGISARRKRNQGRMRRLAALRKEQQAQRRRVGSAKLRLEVGERSGHMVIEARDVTKAYEDRVLIQGLSLRLMRGARVGIIGPNGAGKTTLIRLLTRDLEPDDGRIRHGTRLTTVYLDQHRESLDPGLTVKQVLCGPTGDHLEVHGLKRHVMGYLKDFLFDTRMAKSLVADLSGGERHRLLLAKNLAQPSNLLVLDEPTNDLDLETLDLLQEVLADYPGTLLMVSHDRDFLDRVVTSTLAFEGEGRVVEYAGGYSDVEVQRARARPTPSAPRSSRPKKEGGPSKPRARVRLTFKESRELETLAPRVQELDAEVSELESLLADPEAYARDRVAFEEASRRVGQARAELAAAEERWLELEMRREEASGGTA